MKKIKNWLANIVREAIQEVIKNSPIEDRVGMEIEKLRYDYLPHGACWMCSLPISRTGGYIMWTGKMFCSDICLEKYHSLMQKPNENYKLLDGQPVEVFNTKQR